MLMVMRGIMEFMQNIIQSTDRSSTTGLTTISSFLTLRAISSTQSSRSERGRRRGEKSLRSCKVRKRVFDVISMKSGRI